MVSAERLELSSDGLKDHCCSFQLRTHGGWRGIRTLDGVTHTAFPVPRHKPTRRPIHGGNDEIRTHEGCDTLEV